MATLIKAGEVPGGRAPSAPSSAGAVSDTHHDIMAMPMPRLSRWDRGDGQGAVVSLDSALERAGLPGRLEPAKRLLARSEELAGQAREAKKTAQDRLDQATRGLLADGPIDTAAYGAVLVECGPWLDEDSAGMRGVMQAAQQVRGNATATAFAMAPGLYRELSAVCRTVVEQAAAVPALPKEVWASSGTGPASTLAIRLGVEDAWAELVKLGDRWDAVHAAAELLRETGVFQGELMFPDGCPTSVGVQFLNWQVAVDDLGTLRHVPGPLRLRRAIDAGWRPGLFLAADHRAAAAEAAKPKRRLLLAGLAGR